MRFYSLRHISSPLSRVPFLLLVLFCSVASATHDTITRACTSASASDLNIHYPFCVTALRAAAPPPQPQPPPHGKRSSNSSSSHHHNDLSPSQLAILAARAAVTNATRTRSHIRKLLAMDKVRADEYVRARLEDCLDLYSGAVPALQEGARAVRAGRLDDANAQISAAMDAATTCQDGFEEEAERSRTFNPVGKNCRDLFQLGAICLAIISLV